jgi:hypothetical protein
MWPVGVADARADNERGDILSAQPDWQLPTPTPLRCSPPEGKPIRECIVVARRSEQDARVCPRLSLQDAAWNRRLARAAIKTMLEVLALIHARGYSYNDLKPCQLLARCDRAAGTVEGVWMVDMGARELVGRGRSQGRVGGGVLRLARERVAHS